MEHEVFVQPVGVEVDLDRRLRSGDALIVEARSSVRDGEIVVADSEAGPCVGRYAVAAGELTLYALDSPRAPERVPRLGLRVRGVVIGVRSAL